MFDEMLGWMFITDTINIVSMMSLIGVLHCYMLKVQRSKGFLLRNAPDKLHHHLNAHLMICTALMSAVGMTLTFKAIDTWDQLNSYCHASPMEIWINLSGAFVFWALIPTVMHLTHEQDPEHEFFMLADCECIEDD